MAQCTGQDEAMCLMSVGNEWQGYQKGEMDSRWGIYCSACKHYCQQ